MSSEENEICKHGRIRCTTCREFEGLREDLAECLRQSQHASKVAMQQLREALAENAQLHATLLKFFEYFDCDGETKKKAEAKELAFNEFIEAARALAYPGSCRDCEIHNDCCGQSCGKHHAVRGVTKDE